MARRRHQLDLLPLLDVFMVVLFVFATIQEQRLDHTTRDAAQLERQVAEAEQALRTAAARQRASEEAQQAAERQRAAALAEAQHEAERLRRELQALRQAFVDAQKETRAELVKAGLPEQALERLEVLSRVLEKYSVFEIDLVGQLDAEGQVINRCCYRIDPLLDEWRSCGVVPSWAADRELWLDEGAGGLVEALRRTKGGNAMTLVRQLEAEGSHRIGNLLADQLRERFSDQHIYAEQVPDLSLRCAP